MVELFIILIKIKVGYTEGKSTAIDPKDFYRTRHIQHKYHRQLK